MDKCDPVLTSKTAFDLAEMFDAFTRSHPNVKVLVMLEMPCGCFGSEGTGHSAYLVKRWAEERGHRPPTNVH